MKTLSCLLSLGVVACGGGQKATPAATQSTTEPVAHGSNHVEGHEHGEAAQPSLRIDQIAAGAAMIEELGTHTRPITTTSKEAQAYFDQGVRLIYGFNHDEAARS